jgi:cytochrome c-type biogenesis protein CcmH/NrfF
MEIIMNYKILLIISLSLFFASGQIDAMKRPYEDFELGQKQQFDQSEVLQEVEENPSKLTKINTQELLSDLPNTTAMITPLAPATQEMANSEIESFNCAICQLPFPDINSRNKHCVAKHRSVDGFYHCEHLNCKLTKARTPLVLSKHMNEVHFKTPYILCSYCNKTFTRKSLLKKHLEICEKRPVELDVDSILLTNQARKNIKKQLSCPHCDLQEIFNRSSLADHIKAKHKNNFPYPCFTCLGDNKKDKNGKEIGFYSTTGLSLHNRKCHENIRYQCTKCDSIHPYLGHAVDHIKKMHPELKGHKSHIKQITIAESDSSNQLEQQHAVEKTPVNTVPFTPGTEKIFNEVFVNDVYDQSNQNMSEKSDNEQFTEPLEISLPSPIDQPIDTFDFNVNSKDSTTQSSKGIKKQLKCPYCDLQELFSQKKLATHITANHKGEHPYLCSICLAGGIKNKKGKDIGFNSPNGLIFHNKYHHGKIRYQCLKCGFILSHKTNGRIHIKNRHPEIKNYASHIKQITIAESDSSNQLEQQHAVEKTPVNTVPFTPGTEKIFNEVFVNDVYDQSNQNISEKFSDEQLDAFLTTANSDEDEALQEEYQASEKQYLDENK